jgi:hypothetical protein
VLVARSLLPALFGALGEVAGGDFDDFAATDVLPASEGGAVRLGLPCIVAPRGLYRVVAELLSGSGQLGRAAPAATSIRQD